jgi:hypothetical protein
LVVVEHPLPVASYAYAYDWSAVNNVVPCNTGAPPWTSNNGEHAVGDEQCRPVVRSKADVRVGPKSVVPGPPWYTRPLPTSSAPWPVDM